MMIEYASLACISLLGAMSPGPDFAVVTRHALLGSRKAAILASFGVAAALLIHVGYCSFGVAILLKESHLLFRTLQVIGSCYLAYLGIVLLFKNEKPESNSGSIEKKAFFSGFLTNLLKPKAKLFILSIYTQFVTTDTSILVRSIYGLTIVLTALLWFCGLSFLITHPQFQPRFAHFQTILSKGMGIVLLLLALSVIFSL